MLLVYLLFYQHMILFYLKYKTNIEFLRYIKNLYKSWKTNL